MCGLCLVKLNYHYLNELLTLVIVEIVGVVIFLAKKGMKYLPKTHTDKEPSDTLKFMGKTYIKRYKCKR